MRSCLLCTAVWVSVLLAAAFPVDVQSLERHPDPCCPVSQAETRQEHQQLKMAATHNATTRTLMVHNTALSAQRAIQGEHNTHSQAAPQCPQLNEQRHEPFTSSRAASSQEKASRGDIISCPAGRMNAALRHKGLPGATAINPGMQIHERTQLRRPPP